MANEDEKTIRLTVEDDTARGINSASANISRMHADIQKQYVRTMTGGLINTKNIEAMAKVTGSSYEDVLRRVINTTDATRRQAQAAAQAAQAVGQQARQTERLEQATIRAARQQTVLQRVLQANVRTSGGGGPTGVAGYGYGAYGPGGYAPGGGGGGGGPPIVPVPVGRGRRPPPPGGGGVGAAVAGGLAGMAMRFAAPAVAAETARRSFMSYAGFDTKLRLTQNQTGLLREQIDALGASMKNLSNITGESAEDMLDAWNELREAGNFTPEQTSKMIDEIAKSAIGAGADVKGYSRSLGDIMRNLKVPVEEYTKVNEAMSYAAKEFNINLDEVGPSLSRATAYMAAYGYKGADGAARLVAFLGTVKEATGSASKAGTVLSRVMGGLGDDTLGKALGFATGGLERQMRKSKDPLGSLIRFIKEARDKEAVRKALGIEDIAVFEKFLEMLDTMGDKIKKVKESTGAAQAGENILQGPERAAMRLMQSLDKLTKAFGRLIDSVGGSFWLNEIAKVFVNIAETIELIIEGVKMLFTWDFSKVQSWDQLKYNITAAKDENNKLIMSYKEYKAIKDARGQAAADVYYNKAIKEYEDKNKKKVVDKKGEDDKKRYAAEVAERERMQKKYPELNLPNLPPPGAAPTTTVPVPRAAPGAAPPLFQEGLPSTAVPEPVPVPAPARPAPAAPAPTGPMQQFKMPTPEERDRILREQQKLGAVIGETTAKLVSFGDALEARGGGGLVHKASYTGPVTAQGTATGAGTIGTVAAGGVAPVGQGQAGGGYGGSGDARLMQASYSPSGHGFVGGPGSTYTPASGRAGPPGARGSAFGGGTTLAAPSGGNYPSVPQQAPTAPRTPGAPPTPGAGDGTPDALNMSVDQALKMQGLNETRDREVLKEYMQTGGRNLSGEQNAWCAQFVNGIVRNAGMEGTNSWSAKSFLKWGRGVGADEAMLKGDVMVFNRGNDPNKGHVGMYTGESRINKQTGQREYQMIQGNTGGEAAGGGQVATTWHTRQSIAAIRRGQMKEGQTAQAPAQGPQAPTAAPGGGAPQDYSGGTKKQQTAQTVANAFREAGYSEAAVAGVLRNVEEESKFNASERHYDQPSPKFAGTEASQAHGLFQMGGDEWNAYAAHLQKKGLDPMKSWQDPKEQASYLANRIKTHPQYAKLHKILSDPRTTKEQAAAAFVRYYERPSKANLERREETYRKGVPGAEAYTGRGTSAVAATPAPTTGSEAATRTVESPPTAPAEPREPLSGGSVDQPLNVNLKVNDNEVQFARSSMRRQADREVREARWNSYSDIGAA